MEGWIKSYRAMLDNPIVCKDADHYAVWGYLIHRAAHGEVDAVFNGKRITLKPGQLITGRFKIANHFKMDDNKVYRVLKRFKTEHQIEQQGTNTSSLISILNWDVYQSNEQPIEQQLNNDRTATEQQLNNNRTTSEQRVNTIQECKNIKNDNNERYTHTRVISLDSSFACERARASVRERAGSLLRWIETEIPAILNMAEPFTDLQAESILSKYDIDNIERILLAMHNKGATKNVSAYATFCAYAGNDKILKERRGTLSKLYTYEEMSELVYSRQYKSDDFTMQIVNGKNFWQKTTDVILAGHA